MKRRTYLEAILTVNAILLAGILWVFVSGGDGAGTQSAIANGGPPPGIPNAAGQRNEMIRELKTISKSIREMQSDLNDAEFKVRVTSMPARRGDDDSGADK